MGFIARGTYVLFSSVLLVLICWQWRPIPHTVWDASSPVLAGFLVALFWSGWLILLLATFIINHFDLFGLRQVYFRLRGLASRRAGVHFAARSVILGASLVAWHAVGATEPDEVPLRAPVIAEMPGTAGLEAYADSSGILGVYNTRGRADRSNPFFQPLGTNGRTCATCHVADQALSFTPAYASSLYEHTRGKDPLFASVDGANCPNVAANDRAGHSLILRNGLIRIALPVPSNAQFSISIVRDPYGCALRVDPATGLLTISVYRRPLPSANLGFLSAVMFDARETAVPLSSSATFEQNLRIDLKSQASDAILQHAQAATAPTDAQLDAIVDLESGFYAAQVYDRRAGSLSTNGAGGGVLTVANQIYYPGINDSLGGDPSGAPFSPLAFTLYDAWAPATNRRGGDDGRHPGRADIAAGERIFDTFPLTIARVRGLNDNSALGHPAEIMGTCSTCHDTPNVGDHSLPVPLDIGTTHSTLPGTEPDATIEAALRELSMPDLPVFLIAGCPDPFGSDQPASFYTTDPARALITGQCSDFNRGKGPILRGLAARAPYFHNGAAANLEEVVNFYNVRFNMGLTERQKAQLVAFLGTL